MGNSLSTWHLTIQSAVDGKNFNYNPEYNQPPYIFADYSYFYTSIGVVTGLALLVIFINILCGCKYKKYWYSRQTGNKFLLPVFILPPKDQSALNII